MKKLLVLAVLLISVLISLNAQGFYLDTGIGFGGASSFLDGTSVNNLFTGERRSFGASLDLSSKAGYGPIANIPLYLVGTLGAIFHLNLASEAKDFSVDYVNIGAGLLLYPVPFIQLAGSIGAAMGGIRLFGSDLIDVPLPINDAGIQRDDGNGFFFDVSAAFDYGRRNHGFLAGIKYTGMFVPSLDESGLRLNTHTRSLFVKYGRRHKIKN